MVEINDQCSHYPRTNGYISGKRRYAVGFAVLIAWLDWVYTDKVTRLESPAIAVIPAFDIWGLDIDIAVRVICQRYFKLCA